MASHDSSRRPKPVEGKDLRGLPLTPQEAFVLSRVDGTLSESDLVLLTGLDSAQVKTALERLAELGVLSFGEAVPFHAPHIPRRPSGAIRLGPIVEMRGEPETSHPAAALYDPAEIDEPVDIDLQRKRRILDTFYALESLNHYELLGVSQQADKKAVKAAYYDLVNIFHPDRYYGKSLGSFKTKLERVFARMTEAHDVLTRGQARTEYDQYLASRHRTRELASSLSDAGRAAQELERIEREIAEQARAAERAQQLPPLRGTSERPQTGPTADSSGRMAAVRPLSSAPPTASSPPPAMDAEARRRALARKLGMSAPPPSRSSAPAPPVNTREAAADELKQRYKHRVNELKRRQIERYVRVADDALAAKDLVSASNALKIASSLAGEDPTLTARYNEVQAQAAAALAATYLEQAQYEEREGRFADAARSYERVARGKPSARIFERVAFCLLTSKGDLKQAAEWAKKAVGAAPEDPAFHLTLARIYLDGGLQQSALAEFERAATLAPKDDTIKDWLRRAKRSDA